MDSITSYENMKVYGKSQLFLRNHFADHLRRIRPGDACSASPIVYTERVVCL